MLHARGRSLPGGSNHASRAWSACKARAARGARCSRARPRLAEEPLDSPPARLLAEGFKEAPGKKIAVSGGELDVGSFDDVIAVVGARPPGYLGPVFEPPATGEICDLIERALGEWADQDWVTRLTVNGRELPLNAFVQDLVGSTLAGMCSSLRNAGASEVIEARCRLRPNARRAGSRTDEDRGRG